LATTAIKPISSAEAFNQAVRTVDKWREFGLTQQEVLEGIGSDTDLLRWVSWPDVIGEVARFVRLFYRRCAVTDLR
jgi:hypothetical protein